MTLFLTERPIVLSLYLNGPLASGDLWLVSSIYSNEIEWYEVNVCVHGQDSKSQPANLELDGTVSPSQKCCGGSFWKIAGLQVHHFNGSFRKQEAQPLV